MASSSTRKGAPTGLRLQRPGGGSAGGGEPLHSAGGGWSSGLSVDTGDRGHHSGDPSPNSLYSASPSASVSSQISRNHSFSLDYYALPSPAPQSPSSTGAYPLPPAPPRSQSTSSTYSNYSQGVTPVDGVGSETGGHRPAYLGTFPQRVSSRSSPGGNGQGQMYTNPSSGQQSPGGAHGGEITVSSPPPSPGSRKASWAGSPLGGFLALRKSSAGRSPKTPDSPPSGGRRKSSVTTVDTWELPNRPPPEPPRDDEVLDISWARKMVEEMEADSDGSGSSGGSRRGSTSTGGIPEFGLGVGLDDSQYSDSSVHNGDEGPSGRGVSLFAGDVKRYDRPRAEDLGFSAADSTYNLSSASTKSHRSPISERAPQLPPSAQTTPRQPDHLSSGQVPLGVGPSSRSSSPHSLASDGYSTHEAHPRPELPHSSSLEATNRRIHVIETSPGPSPTSSAHSIPPSDSLYPTSSRTSSNNAGLSTSPAGSGSSSQGAAAGHSPLLSGGRSGFADEVSRRRSSDKARALAFVVPIGGSERSIGQLNEEVRHGTGEIVRLNDYPAEYHQFGEGAHRTGPSRSRDGAEWSVPVHELQHPSRSIDGDEDDDDKVEHEGGFESPALKAARERAARARSLHLASIQVTQATSPTTLSPQNSPALAAYSFGAEQAKQAFKEKRSPQQADPPLPDEGKSQSLLLAVERPKRSSMRPMRTPSPAPSTDVPPPPAPSTDVPSPPPPDVATVSALQISPKRMSTPSHAKQSSTSTIRASSSKNRRRSSTTPEDAPGRRRPSSSLDLQTSTSDERRALSQSRETVSSSRSSGTHAHTLEELTAVLDLAINDSELDSNLAIGPNFGSPVRTSFSGDDGAHDGAVSPKSTHRSTRAPSPERKPPPSEPQAIAASSSRSPDTAAGRVSTSEEKPKPRRMSKEVDPATKTRGSTSSMGGSAGNRSRIGSEDTQAGRSSISSQQSAMGPVTSVVRKTSSMASLGYPMGPPPQPPSGAGSGARQPFYANSSVNAQASRVSLAESTYSPTAASFAKTGKWPRAMVYTDIKTMRSPGERSVAYALKINELQQAETGLGDWLRWKAHGGDSSRTAYRRNSPSLLGTIVEPASRNVSSSSYMSAASEEFPLRGGPTIQATQMRNVSPPSGPPPNLPYPQLAPAIDGMRSSPSSASVRTIGPPGQGVKSNEHAPMNTRPSISSSIASVASNPASFLHALGRRGSTSASQAMRHKARSPPSSISGLPAPGNGGFLQRSELSPRKGSIRGIEISGPTGFSKGTGQVDGDIQPGRTSMNSPLGPRAPSTTFGGPSPLGGERMSLEGSSTGGHTPFAPTPPTQYYAPPMASPATGAQSAALKEMVEILDGDPRLLSKYLQQAGNDVDAALSTYLADQSNGTLLRI